MSSSRLLDIKKLLNTRPSLFSMSLSQNNGDLALKSPVNIVTAGFSLLMHPYICSKDVVYSSNSVVDKFG